MDTHPSDKPIRSKYCRKLYIDPTPDEIWGPGGLAEIERLKRPTAVDPRWTPERDDERAINAIIDGMIPKRANEGE